MKVKYRPQGGRFGYGFDFYCEECTAYLGNSCDDDVLKHPTTKIIKEAGWFKKREEVPIICSQVGVKCEIDYPTMELNNIK